MNFDEVCLIYKKLKSEINSELESFNSIWTVSELLVRLTELKKSFEILELQEAMNILLPGE